MFIDQVKIRNINEGKNKKDFFVCLLRPGKTQLKIENLILNIPLLIPFFCNYFTSRKNKKYFHKVNKRI
jgi:hypothetical protein